MIRKDKLIEEINRYTSGVFYVSRGNQKSNIVRLIITGGVYSILLSRKLPRKNKKAVKNKLIKIYMLLKSETFIGGNHVTINEIIEDTVNKTVEELRKNKIINDFSIDYYTKTERLLQSYNELVKSIHFRNSESSIINMIDEAIKIISDDPYINII